MGLRRTSLTFATATALLGVVVTTAEVGAVPPASVTFDQPGVHTWTVPGGVKYATFDVYGAAGGGAAGGRGAHVRATIPVQARSTLTILVGGRGGDPTSRTGGFGGGAPGGKGGVEFSLPEFGFFLPGGAPGAGGGGASDVRTGAADDSGLATRLLVAGGGGGSAGAPGGAGSLLGDNGGDGQIIFNFLPPEPVPGGVGGGGVLGAGIPGEDGRDSVLDFIFGRPAILSNGQGGGGGGGGLVGGGGGQEAAHTQVSILVADGTSSGGGGGSSLSPESSPCERIVEGGVHAGDGMVVITYQRGGAPGQICG